MIRQAKTLAAIALLAVLATGLWPARPAWSQVRVGMVDVKRVRAESPAFKSALKEIDEMVATFEKKRDRLRGELDTLAAELQDANDRNLPASVTRIRRQLADKSQAFQKFMEETFGTDGIIETHQAELLTPLYDNLAAAAKTVARARGLDLVLDLEQINPLFHDDQLDVTDDVLDELAKLR